MTKTPRAPDRFEACLHQWMEMDRMTRAAEQRIEDALDRYCAGTGPAPQPEDVEFARLLRQGAGMAFSRVLACVHVARVGLMEL